MAEHDPAAEHVMVLALYDVLEENYKHHNEWTLDPFGVENAVHVILRALEKHGLYVVDPREQ